MSGPFSSPQQIIAGFFGSQSPYQSPVATALKDIGKSANDKTRSFQQNMIDLNTSISFMSQYMNTMQDGIDEANKNIIQKIQDIINDIFIIIGGGNGDSGFDWGDLHYVLQAIGALFGFQGISGPVNLADSAGHFITNFLNPNELFQGAIENFTQEGVEGAFEQLLGFLTGIPIIGDVIAQIAGLINQKQPGQQATNLSELGSMEDLDVRNYFVAAYPSHFIYANTGGIAHSGANFLQVDPPDTVYDPAAYHTISSEFPVTAFERIQLDWWQRRQSANYSCSIGLLFKNAAGGVIGTWVDAIKNPPIGASNNTWINYQNEIEVPDGAVKAQARVVLVNPVGTLTGVWQLDDIVIRRAHESPAKTPMWQSIGKDEETTFPRSSLNYGSAQSTGGTIPFFGVHAHDLDRAPQYTPEGFGANRVELGFIRIQKNRAITKIGCITGDSILWFNIEGIFAGLYKMDPWTGLMTLQNPSTASINRAELMVNTSAEFRFDLGKTISVRVDEIYAVALLQRTNIFQAASAVCATTLNNIAPPATQGFPKRNYATAGPFSSLPASIPHSSLVYDNSNRIPFYVME